MTDPKDQIKKHGINISISSIATLIPVLAFIWFFVQPALMSSISAAMAEDIKDQMEDHSAPMETAFKALLRQNIASTRRAIALLEYRRDHDPDSWTEDHARLLADRYLELQALEEAYAAL